MRAGALVLVVMLATAAHAQHCPAPPGAASQLADLDARARLEHIQHELGRTASRANVWRWGWGLGIVAATAGNLVLIPVLDSRASRIDLYVGAATTIVGLVPLLLMPLKVLRDHPALDREVAHGGDLCVLLADAERRLARDADNEADGRAWWLHAGNVLLNGGVGLFLGLEYHHWTSGIINAVGGSIVGEAIIFTQPTGDIGALRRYRRGDLADAPSVRAFGLGASFAF